MRDAAEAEYDRYVGAGAQHVDPKDVQGDLDALRKRTDDVERYDTKRVAHMDAAGRRWASWRPRSTCSARWSGNM